MNAVVHESGSMVNSNTMRVLTRSGLSATPVNYLDAVTRFVTSNFPIKTSLHNRMPLLNTVSTQGIEIAKASQMALII